MQSKERCQRIIRQLLLISKMGNGPETLDCRTLRRVSLPPLRLEKHELEEHEHLLKGEISYSKV